MESLAAFRVSNDSKIIIRQWIFFCKRLLTKVLQILQYEEIIEHHTEAFYRQGSKASLLDLPRQEVVFTFGLVDFISQSLINEIFNGVA